MPQQPTLPIPEKYLIEHSQRLIDHIHQAIQTHHGAISFQQFMQLVLYAPGLGYYSAGSRKFGRDGDFVTAPEISALFSQCVAKQCLQVFELIDKPSILEFGAGSGIMAADILLSLETSQQLPEHYFILEISAELIERQQQTLQQHCPHLLKRVTWLSRLPVDFSGVILANEVLDAMPICKFRYQDNQFQEYQVTWQQQRFAWQLADCHYPALDKLADQLPQPYESEINLQLPAWIHSISDCLQQGLVLLIDYGFPRHEFYHPDRTMGTLMCHFRHRAHSDPFVYPGLQDITAHVDFTAVAEAADEANLQVAGFTTQAGFLLGCGLLDAVGNGDALDINQQIKLLTLPSEMGELFKVIALTRGIEVDLRGFAEQDRLATL